MRSHPHLLKLALLVYARNPTKTNKQQASDKCQREKRKTINGDDLLWALSTLGFECYVDPLKAYLAKYRESEKNAMAAAGGGGKDGTRASAERGDTD